MSEPRILPLTESELSEEGRALAARLRASFGLSTAELPEAIATMLRHPDLYRAQVDFVIARGRAAVLERRDLELIILRTSRLCSCDFVWGEHVVFGKQAGVTAEEIEWLTQGSSAPGWNERDRAVVRLTEELHEKSNVSDETWAVIAQNFTDKQIIEMLTMTAAYHESAFIYNTLRVRLIPGNPGLSAR